MPGGGCAAYDLLVCHRLDSVGAASDSRIKMVLTRASSGPWAFGSGFCVAMPLDRSEVLQRRAEEGVRYEMLWTRYNKAQRRGWALEYRQNGDAVIYPE